MLNLDDYEYAASRWQDIYNHLKMNYEVFTPAQKIGDCYSRYIVVKNDGATKHNTFSSIVENYSVMCYIPKNEYSQLEIFVQEVKAAMDELKPLVIFTGVQTPSFYDEQIKAHMVSLGYINYKKMIGG